VVSWRFVRLFRFLDHLGALNLFVVRERRV
jgi:hypothetical protein